MAKTTVEVLVDDIDGSEGAETVRLGWNGDWRELELSRKNVASLTKALDKYWAVGRPVATEQVGRRRSRATTSSRGTKAARDPRSIRVWATENGIAVPARGRIPNDVERQYNEANRRS